MYHLQNNNNERSYQDNDQNLMTKLFCAVLDKTCYKITKILWTL